MGFWPLDFSWYVLIMFCLVLGVESFLRQRHSFVLPKTRWGEGVGGQILNSNQLLSRKE